MKRKAILFFYLYVVTWTLAWSEEISLQVFFSPNGGCTAALCKEISAAKKSIRVQAYGFTSEPIADALIAANKRGVLVVAILDRSNKTARYSEAKRISQIGILVLIDSNHTIAHNKVMIIDDEVTITGSFNFSANAEKSNAENLIIIKDTETAKKYSDNWKAHAVHSSQF